MKIMFNRKKTTDGAPIRSVLNTIGFALLLLLMNACGENGSNPANNNTKSADDSVAVPQQTQAPNNYSGCYLRVIQRDTLVAILEQNGSLIRGRLHFDNYEKDGSSGTVKGQVEGDVIRLLYHFQSEGVNSIMEMRFKTSGTDLIPAYGEIGVRGDTTYYSDPVNITYPEADKLSRLPCESLPSKYRE